jgi:hypothetical protein
MFQNGCLIWHTISFFILGSIHSDASDFVGCLCCNCTCLWTLLQKGSSVHVVEVVLSSMINESRLHIRVLVLRPGLIEATANWYCAHSPRDMCAPKSRSRGGVPAQQYSLFLRIFASNFSALCLHCIEIVSIEFYSFWMGLGPLCGGVTNCRSFGFQSF